jgi:hypothetical protein
MSTSIDKNPVGKFTVVIPYPIKQGPYSVESTKMQLIRTRDFYQMPPELWFTYLLGMSQCPHWYSWHRQAAKELLEENYRIEPTNRVDHPYYPYWIGEDYMKEYDDSWYKRLINKLFYEIRLAAGMRK